MTILCDRQTGKNPMSFPSCLESGSGHATGRNATCLPSQKTICQVSALTKTAVLLLSLIFAFEFGGFAQDSPPTEYEIKAAFLYNFAKFVQWPKQAMAAPKSPITIGVLGDNVFHGDLEKTIHGKKINDHPLLFKEFHSVGDVTNCQILFISPSEENHLPKILDGLHGMSILTVGQTDDFVEAGGMINFVIEDNRVHFQINNEAAKKAGLTISSKLLSLATHRH
jgi:hypothetical protein